MAAPAGFSDLINRKYDIAQTEAANRGTLEQAQAANITASTPFENALKAAQTRQTSETAKTIGPLAEASQAATYAGVGETQARTGLFGAQTGLTGAQTQDVQADLGSIGLLGSRYYLDQLRRGGTRFAPGASGGGQVGVPQPQSSVLGPTATPGVPASPSPASKITLGLGQDGYTDEFGNYVHLAKGTSRVMPAKSPGKAVGGNNGFAGMLEAAKGANRVPGQGSGRVDKVKAMLAPGEAVVNKAGVKHIPGGRAAIAKANAKGVKEMGLSGKPASKAKGAPPARAMPHFAAGIDNIPAPGQTTSNGSWEGPTNTPAPPPPVAFPVPSAPPATRVFGKRVSA